jgi:outer membrane protein assembly factor BamB
MPSSSTRVLCRMVVLISFCVIVSTAHGQTAAPGSAQTAWSVKLNASIRWQQVTPSGVLLVATDSALTAVDIESGRVAWEKPELGGMTADSIHPVEGSLLMEAKRPDLLLIFDPVTGAVIFDSRALNLTRINTRRVLPQSATLLVHGQRASGPAIAALYELATGKQLWTNDSLFTSTEPSKSRGLGALMQALSGMAAESEQLEVLQAGPAMIVVYTQLGLRALDAHTGAVRWSAKTPTSRFGAPAFHVRLFPSVDKADRIYASFDDSLMAYRLSDGQPLWTKAPKVEGRIRDIVQHPAGIVMLPEAPPDHQAMGNRRIVNGVVQTSLNVARYEDGTTIAPKSLRMHGNVVDAMIAGNTVVLSVDAESKTFVNVLDVASASLRLKKDVKIKGQVSYAELTPAGLLYISRPDATINGEVNVIELESGQPRFKDAIESGKPLSSSDYKAARYYLHHAVEGRTLYVFANRDHRLYAVDRDAATFKSVGDELKLKGGEDPTAMEIRPEGIVLSSEQNLVILGRDGQLKKQVYYPAPQASGLLRALYAINAVRAGLYGAAASAYGDAFAQASAKSTAPTTQQVTEHLADVYTKASQQLQGYSRQSAAMATKRFKASLDAPGFVFMLTPTPEGKGNVLLQIDKDTAEPRARVDLGKEKEPVYAVDDIANMLFLQTKPDTVVGYRLSSNMVSTR